MRLSVVTFMRPGPDPRGRPLGRIVDYARQIEKRGFPGIWVTDSVGRGRPTLDPLVGLGGGSRSTRADFDLLGADYDQRFRTLLRSLEVMRRAWGGEPVNGGALSP